MKNHLRSRPTFPFVLVLLELLLFSPPIFSRQSASAKRIRLVPHFSPGQTLRYSVQMTLDTNSQSTGPIVNPEGAQKIEESVNVTLRIDVLSVSNATATLGQARIRATYEKAVATTSSDSYDPDTAAVADQFKRLEGQSLEFTLEPDGKISDATGLKDTTTDPSRAAIVSQWLSQLTLGASLPQKGIAVGEKWSSEQPLENMPLKGLAWRTNSSYLRNEPCREATVEPSPVAGAKSPTPSVDECAVILTKSEIVSSGSDKDRTPDVFRQNGLRTSGKWTGSGEGLTSISLHTGMVVSVTQSSATQMDFTIMTDVAQNRMRYAGGTHSQSDITLVSQSANP
ncbi:MAG TPA: hypothetical protein VGR81_12990 [Candidatus Acidoferrales bacterium]|nr:hypothetical protein [Candidatus Acidoferrales bacterium]